MSISMRNTKAQMYSEIERQRDHIDKQRHQLRAAADEIERLRAKIEELGQDLDAAKYEMRCSRLRSKEMEAKLADVTDQLSQQPRASQPERRTRNLMITRLAVVCKATVRWDEEKGFVQFEDGNWVAIPTHTVNFVAKGIEQ